MISKRWLRNVFGPQVLGSRPSRRGKSRQAPRHGQVPRLEFLEDRLVPAVLTVSSTADGSLTSLAGDGKLELREAIQLATHPHTTIDGFTTTDTDNTIQFASAIDGQTISLNTWNNPAQSDLPIGEATVPGPTAFVIEGNDLTIDGETGLTKGITIARDTNKADYTGGKVPSFRIFFVGSNSFGTRFAQLTLEGLTLRDGLAQGGDGVSSQGAGGGGAAGLGGAIYNQGLLTIQDSTLTGNTAQGGNGAGGGQVNGGGGGGGLGTPGYTGQTVDNPIPGGDGAYGVGGDGGGPNGGTGTDSPFDDGGGGQFGGGGGGGYGFGGFITVGVPFHSAGGAGGFGGGGGGGGSGDTFGAGSPGGHGGFGGGGGGGGYYAAAGAGGFGGSDGHNNDGGGGAGMGGAVFNQGGQVRISNSTLTANTAKGGTGGSGGKGLGGGVFNYNGTLEATNSTFSANTVVKGDKSIYSPAGSDVFSVGFNGGTAKVFINNSILGQSDSKTSVDKSNTPVEDFTGLASADPNDSSSTPGSNVTSGSGNLIRYSSGFTGDQDSVVLTGDPQLGPLQNNGGLTQTMALGASSPAIDGGGFLIRPFFDQRGFPRNPDGLGVDIGAYELAQPTITSTASPAVTLGTTAPTLSDSVVLAGASNPTGNLVFTLTGPGGFTYTQTDPMSGQGTFPNTSNGTYTASTTLPTNGPVAGLYTWKVTYAGDANNLPASDQGGTVEQTRVSPASPTITTTARKTLTLANNVPALSDTAVVSGGYFPSGSLVFTVTLPSGATVPVATEQLTGNGTYTAALPLPTTGTTGTYTWHVSYAGDANNNAAADQGGCAEQATVVPGVFVVCPQLVIIGGPCSNDHVEIDPVGTSKTGSTGIKVHTKLDGVETQTTYTQAFTAIDVYMQNGDDVVHVADTVTIPTNVSAGNGHDNIHLGNGNNTVLVGNGKDQVQAGDGNNTVVANTGAGQANINLGNGSNRVTVNDTSSGQANIQLGDGNNTVIVGDGNDHLHLGDGNNLVVAGSGNNQVQAGNGKNLIVGGGGKDNIHVGNGSNILIDGAVSRTELATLTQVLSEWVQYGNTSGNVATIRGQLTPIVAYNTTNANTLQAGKGVNWYWYIDLQDHTTRKATDLLN